MSHALSLSSAQRRIVFTAGATYACYYMGRLNVSMALPMLATTLGVSRAQIGILGTVFFWTYGLGQFVNGELGNLISPRRMVMIGLFAIAIANLLFAAQTLLWPMIILWGLNGIAQSSGWAPMLRIISDHLTAAQRSRVSALFALSYSIGAAAALFVTGLLLHLGGWRAAFWIPGLFMFGVMALWWRFGVDAAANRTTSRVNWHSTQAEIARLLPMLLSSLLAGFIISGATIWTPTYVIDSGIVPPVATGAVAALMPLVSIAGMLASNAIIRRYGRVELALGVLLALSAILLLGSGWLSLPFQSLSFILALAALGGVGGLLTSAIPLAYATPGRTSSAAGLMNAVINLSGGVSGVAVGALLEASGWSTVFLIWGICAALALALTWVFARRASTRPNIPAPEKA